MIIRFQHVLADELPEETQMQIAAQLIKMNVGFTVEIIDPLRIEEGDRKYAVTLPIVSYQDSTDYVAKYLTGVMTERMEEITKEGPVL